MEFALPVTNQNHPYPPVEMGCRGDPLGRPAVTITPQNGTRQCLAPTGMRGRILSI
ncbi:MAG: hypothetical protein SFZ02_20370 [bacterium]|nr:hypothetical protein [bacterium]